MIFFRDQLEENKMGVWDKIKKGAKKLFKGVKKVFNKIGNGIKN